MSAPGFPPGRDTRKDDMPISSGVGRPPEAGARTVTVPASQAAEMMKCLQNLPKSLATARPIAPAPMAVQQPATAIAAAAAAAAAAGSSTGASLSNILQPRMLVTATAGTKILSTPQSLTVTAHSNSATITTTTAVTAAPRMQQAPHHSLPIHHTIATATTTLPSQANVIQLTGNLSTNPMALNSIIRGASVGASHIVTTFPSHLPRGAAAAASALSMPKAGSGVATAVLRPSTHVGTLHGMQLATPQVNAHITGQQAIHPQIQPRGSLISAAIRSAAAPINVNATRPNSPHLGVNLNPSGGASVMTITQPQGTELQRSHAILQSSLVATATTTAASSGHPASIQITLQPQRTTDGTTKTLVAHPQSKQIHVAQASGAVAGTVHITAAGINTPGSVTPKIVISQGNVAQALSGLAPVLPTMQQHANTLKRDAVGVPSLSVNPMSTATAIQSSIATATAASMHPNSIPIAKVTPQRQQPVHTPVSIAPIPATGVGLSHPQQPATLTVTLSAPVSTSTVMPAFSSATPIGTSLALSSLSSTAAATVAAVASIPGTSPATGQAISLSRSDALPHSVAPTLPAAHQATPNSGMFVQQAHRPILQPSVAGNIAMVTAPAVAGLHGDTVRPERPAQLASYLPEYFSYLPYHTQLVYRQAQSLSQTAGVPTPTLKPGLVPGQSPNFATALQAVSVGTGQAPRFGSPVVMPVDQSRTIHTNQYTAAVSNGANDSTSLVSTGATITYTVASNTAALPTGAQSATAVVAPVPNASPRPSILRKRTSDGTAVKKPLALSLSSSSSITENVTPISRSDSAPLSTNSSPKNSIGDSRESSQSSTDTALSNDASTPSGISEIKIKQEPVDTIEMNHQVCSVSAGNLVNSISAVNNVEASPRKKPRKQLLMPSQSHEEIKHHTSSDEEIMDLMRDSHEIKMERMKEFIDDEGVRWTTDRTKPNISLLNFYNCTWKSRNNHFLRQTDVKPKDDRRPTVNELSNTKGVAQKTSGWKLWHMAAQLEDLCDGEKLLYERIGNIQNSIAPAPNLDLMEGEGSTIHELTQGNIQRCQLVADQLNEARNSMLKILEHKQKIQEIVTKHVSKRPIKKKERS